jgi:hypothetical protein
MNSTEISMLRVFRRLLDKLKETNADECPRALGAVHVVIRVWESRPPRRQTSVAAGGLAKSGFNCELPRVFAICPSREASPSEARGKNDK